ncbi:MAG: cation transporter, partial [Deltaproteobacteria bacterium CG_4_10_14_0_2_um_filter_43_8]
MVMHLTDKPVPLLERVVYASVAVGISLMVIKFVAYGLTGSAAILSDAAESIVNVVTALFSLYSLKVSFKPPDECHPYGHGKIEFFSAALEGGAIVVAAIWVIHKSVDELVVGSTIKQLDVGVILVAVAAVVNAALGYYLVKIGKREGSLIIEADGRHVMTDVITSAGVITGLIVVLFTKWYFLDPIIAILAALNIVYTGWMLLKQAASGMMDRASEEDDKLINDILSAPSFRDVCGYHKLRHRKSGNIHFVDFHLIMPRVDTVEQAHVIATAVEAQIASALGDASVMAHIEPCKRRDCPNCRR